MNPEQIAQIVAQVIAQQEQAHVPDVHLVDRVDTRDYIAPWERSGARGSDAPRCKGLAAAVAYVVVASDQEITFAQTGISPCRASGRAEYHGYCGKAHAAQAQAKTPEQQARMKAHLSGKGERTVKLPMPERAAVVELARMLGIKLLADTKAA